MKKSTWILLLLSCCGAATLHAQTAKFNLSQASHTVSGWTNVAGDPSMNVLTSTSNGITLSTVNTANWAPYSGVCSFDANGSSTGGFFPGAVMTNNWFMYADVAFYNSLTPQFQLSGLNKDSLYQLKMTASSTSSFISNPTRYTVAGKTLYGYIDINAHNNTTAGATFNNVQPDTSGHIRIYVNTVPGSEIADICGIQIVRGATSPLPVITITNPTMNDVLAEDGNVHVTAAASESGGTIVKVEFFVGDTTKIGESTTAPYAATWINPDEGKYKLTATAVDANGVSNSTSINVSVESLTSFWSMTGNISANPDSNFVGTVDSLRLAFRTKNIERVSISPTGNVGIGIITPSAQLHTTGSVRFAGVTADSTKTRVLVSDSSGNLFYRNVSSLGATNHWLFSGTTTYDSLDNIGIGTSNTQGYKLAVNGTAIFTKVKVKTAGTWPDYVFKKGYHLPDLKELEQYITQHKHLPGITPEADVKQDGIDVAAHEAALLKKIEELTLYLIQQNARLEKQQKEIDELKQQVKAKK